jgi:hypothetical protein
MMIKVVWISLILLEIGFIIVLSLDYWKSKHQLESVSWIKTGLIGFVTNFFDVLRIGEGGELRNRLFSNKIYFLAKRNSEFARNSQSCQTAVGCCIF